MIWSDRDINNELALGHLIIEPFNKEQVQPASYDVRLGDQFKYFAGPNTEIIDPGNPIVMLGGGIKYQGGFVLESLDFCLAVTQEKITLNSGTVGRIEGKSSLGRLGLAVHITAGFIDPGFSGHLTLEMFNASPRPIRLYAGMFIAQISFESMRTKCDKPYSGRYTDAAEKCEPTASRVNLKVGI